MRSLFVSYILLIFFGVFGVHKLYLGRVGMAFLYFVTGGIFLIGCIIDFFTLPSQVEDVNRRQ